MADEYRESRSARTSLRTLTSRQASLNELGTALATSISTIFADRLMISVRRHYFGHEHRLSEPIIHAVRFKGTRARTVRIDATSLTDITGTGSTTLVEPVMAETALRGCQCEEYEMSQFLERTGF